jgi:hypothetical protein
MLSAEHKADIRSASNDQLRAIWNILQWGGLAVSDEASRAHDEAVRLEVSDEMNRRCGFRPEPGRLVKSL